MRLIDADSLVRNIKKWEKYIGNYEKEIPYNEDIYVSIMMTIEDEPTVDAVPVRYGHYIMGKNGECYCSECKRIDDKYSVARYCWFCGAWMQGKENRF